MRRTVVIAVLGIVLTSAAIAGLVRLISARADTANGSVPVRNLSSIVGEYVSVNDSGAPARVLDGLPVRLTLEKGRVRAYAGCNSMQGQARVARGRLVVNDLAMTEIGCPPDVTAQEQWVLSMLQARPHVERSGPYLYLSWDSHWLGLSSDPADQPVVSSAA